MRPKVFIATPYSSNSNFNTEMSVIVSKHLIELGFAPFNPLLWHYSKLKDMEYEAWMEIMDPYLQVSDAVYRIAGESCGANREINKARKLRIPVYYEFETLCKDWNIPY